MHVVAAPDKFKGSLTAPEAAAAIAAGWRRADATAEIERVPVADGGDGTLDALLTALGGRREEVPVTGPLGDPVQAAIGIAGDEDERVAVVEIARASGLQLLAPERLDALHATSRGTGELLLAAARHRPRRIIVCIGGSATTDGGAGMAQALGVRLLDEDGEDLGPGGEALRRLERIDPSGLEGTLRDVDVMVASDVDNPLLGPRGAAAVYAPQKGASVEDVEILEAGLRRFAVVMDRDLGADVSELPGAGAAGGLGAGLVAFLGATIRSGFDVVAEAVGLRDRLRGADVVVTGEGRYDEQSSRGKAPAGVLAMARELGCRTVLITGQLVGASPAADLVLQLADRTSSIEDAMRHARSLVEEAAAEAATRLGGGP